MQITKNSVPAAKKVLLAEPTSWEH